MAEAKRDARVRCRDIMTASVTTATPDMSLQQVAGLMRDGDMGSIPVVEAGKLVGIVTDRDMVVRALASGLGPSSPIADNRTECFMTTPRERYFDA